MAHSAPARKRPRAKQYGARAGEQEPHQGERVGGARPARARPRARGASQPRTATRPLLFHSSGPAAGRLALAHRFLRLPLGPRCAPKTKSARPSASPRATLPARPGGARSPAGPPRRRASPRPPLHRRARPPRRPPASPRRGPAPARLRARAQHQHPLAALPLLGAAAARPRPRAAQHLLVQLRQLAAGGEGRPGRSPAIASSVARTRCGAS